MTRGRISQFVALALALTAMFVLSACGDKKDTNSGPTGPTGSTAKLGPIPTGITGPTKGPKIKHTPQAGKYSGEESKAVATLDALAEAVNKDDAQGICDNILSEADVKYMNKQGKCFEVIKRLFAYYAGYKITTNEVKINGDTATANAVLTANQQGKKVSVPSTFQLRKEGGVWKVYIGADKAAADASSGQQNQQ